jgi:HTH-type transcriptional regulator / antitoxin HipB
MTSRRKSRTPLPDRVSQKGALGALVSARREELSLRQAELAELADVGARFVNDLEAGKATVRLDKVLAVLGVLGMHLEVEYGPAKDGVSAGTRVSEIYGLKTRPSKNEQQT